MSQYKKIIDGKEFKSAAGSTYRHRSTAELRAKNLRKKKNLNVRIIRDGPHGPHTLWWRKKDKR
jgi:hypothetical protein